MRLTVARVKPTRAAIAPCLMPSRASANTSCLIPIGAGRGIVRTIRKTFEKICKYWFKVVTVWRLIWGNDHLYCGFGARRSHLTLHWMSAQGSVGFRWRTITGPYHANFSQVETQKFDPHWFYCLQWGCNNLFCQECIWTQILINFSAFLLTGLAGLLYLFRLREIPSHLQTISKVLGVTLYSSLKYDTQERALRFVFSDYTSPYSDLLKHGKLLSLSAFRIMNLAIEMYKCVYGINPPYLNELFISKDTRYNLCDSNRLQ